MHVLYLLTAASTAARWLSVHIKHEANEFQNLFILTNSVVIVLVVDCDWNWVGVVLVRKKLARIGEATRNK